MFEGLKAVHTPHGPAFMSVGGGANGLADMPRFDSSMVDEYVEAILRPYPHLRADAQGSAITARGLEHVFTKVYEIEFPSLRAAEFLPVNTEVPPGAKSFTYRMFQAFGNARVISDYAADLPMQGLSGQEWPSPIVIIGAAYGFSIVDLQRGALGNVPLESMLARQARYAIEYLAEQIAAVGLPNDGVPGFANAPGVVATTKLSTGTWLSQVASLVTATPAAPSAALAAVQGIVADLNAAAAQISTQTNGIHNATTALLPLAAYNAIKSAPRSPAYSDDTMLGYMKKLTGLDIQPWLQLNTAGSGGVGRMMVYEKSPDVVEMIVAQPFTQLPPQPKNLLWQVPCLAQVGGVMVPYPLAVTYMDGV